MNGCVAHNPEVLAFARRELARYYRAVTGVDVTNSRFGPFSLTIDASLDGERDQWAVRVLSDGVVICGAHGRAVLYGVYAVCTECLGIAFVSPQYEHVPTRSEADIAIVAMEGRAAVAARSYTMDHPPSYTDVLPLLSKLGYNMVSISAEQWKRHKEAMLPLMRERGLELSVSGHDLGYYIPPERYFSQHPDWFSLFNGERVPDQLCFSSTGLQEELVRVLSCYCREESVRELVVMFNDNAKQCQCDRCRKTGDLGSYLRFIRKVDEGLKAVGQEVDLYSIAYNVALSWGMLEDISPEATNHCVVACWGRDYRYALSEDADPWARRFHEAFENWGRHQRQQGRHMAVFEYYGDHWMMGTLLPPMSDEIRRDVRYMESIGVHRIDVLRFGFRGSLEVLMEVLGRTLPDTVQEYNTEQQLLWFNFWAAGRCMWNTCGDLDAWCQAYAQARFGPWWAEALAFWKGAERALAPLSRFSSDMFKLRITDAWHRDDFSLRSTGHTCVHPWEPETDDPITHRAAQACAEAAQELEPLMAALLASGDASALTDGQCSDLEDLRRCATYLWHKVSSLREQYAAQLAIEKAAFAEAQTHLQEACRLERLLDGASLTDCERWLAVVRETAEQQH